MTKPKPKAEPPKEEKKAEEAPASNNNAGSGDPAQAEQPAADATQEAKGGEMDVD